MGTDDRPLQLDLFQRFVPTPTVGPEGLSNAIDLWDAIPKYCVSRLRMSRMRTKGGALDILKLPFRYRGRELLAVIIPARLEVGSGTTYCYPSGREEVVEHALRKLAADQAGGWYDTAKNISGVRFSLHGLRTLLVSEDHAFRYDEIVEALNVLSLSSLEIRAMTGESGRHDQAFARANYLTALSGVTRQRYERDRSARWTAQFHPLITLAMEDVAYRQFNFRSLMRCRTQLARFLVQRCVLLYTQAAKTAPWEILFSTIQRDSALLNGYTHLKSAVQKVDEAWEELRDLGVVASVERERMVGPRGRTIDVRHRIIPTETFVREQMAANQRRNLAMLQLEKPAVNNSASTGGIGCRSQGE